MDMMGNKNPVITGVFGASWTSLDLSLVEAAGVEPVFCTPLKTTTYTAVSTCLSLRM
jgi:hypothetical protein